MTDKIIPFPAAKPQEPGDLVPADAFSNQARRGPRSIDDLWHEPEPPWQCALDDMNERHRVHCAEEMGVPGSQPHPAIWPYPESEDRE